MEKHEKAYKDYKDGMKYKDIAVKHGVSIDTVRSWKTRHWNKKDVHTNPKKKCTQKEKDVHTKISHNWIEIEKEYISDISRKPITLEGLAKKHNIAPQTIYEYSANNNWKEKRRTYIEVTKKKVVEKTSEIMSDDIAKVNIKHFNVSSKIIDAIDGAFEMKELYKYMSVDDEGERTIITLDMLNTRKLAELTNAFEKIHKTQRQTVGILTEFERQKLELERLKLEIDIDNEEENRENELSVEELKALAEQYKL